MEPFLFSFVWVVVVLWVFCCLVVFVFVVILSQHCFKTLFNIPDLHWCECNITMYSQCIPNSIRQEEWGKSKEERHGHLFGMIVVKILLDVALAFTTKVPIFSHYLKNGNILPSIRIIIAGDLLRCTPLTIKVQLWGNFEGRVQWMCSEFSQWHFPRQHELQSWDWQHLGSLVCWF